MSEATKHDKKWCAFSGAYDCPLRNNDDAYCKESLLKGYCKRKHDKQGVKPKEEDSCSIKT